MPKYACEICDETYSHLVDAQKCESKKIIGLNLEPGLLLIHKQTSKRFLVFYGELQPEKHEKTYNIEEFYDFSFGLKKIVTLGNHKIKNSDLEKKISHYKIAKNEKVKEFNEQIKYRLIGGPNKLIMKMKEYGIEKLHNNFLTPNLKTINP